MPGTKNSPFCFVSAYFCLDATAILVFRRFVASSSPGTLTRSRERRPCWWRASIGTMVQMVSQDDLKTDPIIKIWLQPSSMVGDASVISLHSASSVTHWWCTVQRHQQKRYLQIYFPKLNLALVGFFFISILMTHNASLSSAILGRLQPN